MPILTTTQSKGFNTVTAAAANSAKKHVEENAHYTPTMSDTLLCLHRPVDAIKGISRNKEHPEVSAEASICVLHGTDSLSLIGMPSGEAIKDVRVAQEAWQAELRSLFPVASTALPITPDLSKFQADPGAVLPPHGTFLLYLE
jgi:hypothetical protein